MKDFKYVKMVVDTAFYKEENGKLIEFLMKGNDQNMTALHLATDSRIVKFLLGAFSPEEKKKLIEYVMKENENKITALQFSFPKWK